MTGNRVNGVASIVCYRRRHRRTDHENDTWNYCSSFRVGVENITNDVLCDVRVEVHLNNGLEIGPTEEVDLEAGDTIDVNLSPDDGHQGEGEEEHD